MTTSVNSKPETKLTDVERIKTDSKHLRGSLTQSLLDRETGAIATDDTQLSKFHGIYQQDNRDIRAERKKQKLEPAYSFMIRVRVPGGVMSSEQWLAMDELATTHANNTLRITTRQAIQFHGVVKKNLKQTIASINDSLMDTIAACGDVNRNVMCTPNPVQSRLHSEVYELSAKLSEHLTPKTNAYHEIWLDKKKLLDTKSEQEPIYGDTYLPRKFKIGIAIPPRNDVDVFTQDLGFIAIMTEGQLLGFNVVAGGGMGMSHGEPDTYPRLASVIGFCPPDKINEVAEKVVTVQRDYGDRTNRKHARLKYTIDDRGLDWFTEEVNKRLGWTLQQAKPYEFNSRGDRLGWTYGTDGLWHLTVHISNGRLVDGPDGKLLTGMRKIAETHQGEIRLTANQNLIVAGIPSGNRNAVQSIAEAHGLIDKQLSRLVSNAIACVAFPTCGLAMAESERYMPSLLEKIDGLLDANGLKNVPIVSRMTGCPNGCARPYAAEIGFVGKAPGRYNLYLGASFVGDRLNTLYKENIDEAEILESLEPIFADYASNQKEGERFGDYVIRAGYVTATANRSHEVSNVV
ncbi:MAG: NADPH-dependent assimilatory sulfite reductase hemoprotein subunit [Pseudomonadota bacterium]